MKNFGISILCVHNIYTVFSSAPTLVVLAIWKSSLQNFKKKEVPKIQKINKSNNNENRRLACRFLLENIKYVHSSKKKNIKYVQPTSKIIIKNH